MRRRFSSQPWSSDRRQRLVRRQRVRRLTFDSLEDRRLLAGLNIFVYDDANASGTWEQPSESPLAEQVVFVDNDDNGRFDSDEPYAISGTDGKALIDNLSNSIARVRLFGATNATLIEFPSSTSIVDVKVASAAATDNTPPVLNSLVAQGLDEDSELSLPIALFASAATDVDDDPLVFFAIGQPAHGSLIWSVEAGGAYKPIANFNGADSIVVKAFDGKAFSAPVTLDITVQSIDDLPTGIQIVSQGVPENELGHVIGSISIIDIDGGSNSIRFSPDDLVEVQNEVWKLMGDKALNFEENSSIPLTISVIVGDNETSVYSENVILTVENRNDPPSALLFEGQARVEEFITGYEFGTIRVVDEDVDAQYDFLVSDNRFVVADGKLSLKPNTSLVYADASSVSVTVTAVSKDSSDSISETIDIEVVRAAPPWQNRNWPLDVNNDGELSPLDVLLVINALNRWGMTPLDRPPPPGSPNFVDVNGDRFLSPIDALILINALNRQSRGSSEGGGSGGGSGEGKGKGEGEEGVPDSTPLQLAEEGVPASVPQPLVEDSPSVDSSPSIEKSRSIARQRQSNLAIDDDSLCSSNARKSARRVR